MSDGTKIEWADATVNAVNGCSVLSPGCTNCYAMRLAGTRLKHHPSRIGLTKPSKAGPVWTGEVRLNQAALQDPLRWKRPRRIFWNAHGDLFHEAVPDVWIDRVFAVCARTPQHKHMILTKRSARMREYCNHLTSAPGARALADHILLYGGFPSDARAFMERIAEHSCLPNVWLGVSAEDQVRADERIPDLLATPAAVRFLSAEPLLGPLNIAWALSPDRVRIASGLLARGQFSPGLETLRPLDWVIAGGESGPAARPMHPDWARSLRDQCQAAGAAFHFKQWGEWRAAFSQPAGTPGHYAMLHNHEGSWSSTNAIKLDEYPRQFSAFGAIILECVGKKAAGRELDGRTWSEFPA